MGWGCTDCSILIRQWLRPVLRLPHPTGCHRPTGAHCGAVAVLTSLGRTPTPHNKGSSVHHIYLQLRWPLLGQQYNTLRVSKQMHDAWHASPALHFRLTYREFACTILGRISRGLPTRLLCDLGDGHRPVWLCLNPLGEPDAFNDPTTFFQLVRERFEEMRAARIYAPHHHVSNITAQKFQHMQANVLNDYHA